MSASCEPRLRVRSVGLPLACCAVEVAAARRLLAGTPDAETSTASDVVVVAGTVTDVMAASIRSEYDDVRERTGADVPVVAFGSCAISGGPYWDSYAVCRGVAQILPVDVCVPGCPPRPEALIEALGSLGSTEGD
ncbi:NADH-quinone oxidoreductase subunit B [Austwickia sp. TVS 96-490-7B]|uniref:NADH-quinone oxidoreductase subunit B n=1 Tax=Austwickia sp. TVS 96-490-7B TaxID=2830843 RepID=UPI001C594B5B|nr:hypothetical protein [Austwickia sp. TVS 96-490-7B]MBW3085682.1 NADH-quinone oxidoreductase subunit B [Austwickia sp. TVS 96-490-7B]